MKTFTQISIFTLLTLAGVLPMHANAALGLTRDPLLATNGTQIILHWIPSGNANGMFGEAFASKVSITLKYSPALVDHVVVRNHCKLPYGISQPQDQVAYFTRSGYGNDQIANLNSDLPTVWKNEGSIVAGCQQELEFYFPDGSELFDTASGKPQFHVDLNADLYRS